MIKKFVSFVLLVVVASLLLTAAAPMPQPTITLVSGLPTTMTVGETYNVTISVTSDMPFTSATAMPSDMYPGRGVVAVRGPDRAGAGTSALLNVTFTAKSLLVSPTGQATTDIVLVVVGVRYQGGYVVTQQFDFPVDVIAP